jgi:hypothetical protein
MNCDITYEIWVLGYDSNGYAIDYDRHIATINDEKLAARIFEYCGSIVEKPQNVPMANLVLEKVENHDNIHECVDVLAETEL